MGSPKILIESEGDMAYSQGKYSFIRYGNTC